MDKNGLKLAPEKTEVVILSGIQKLTSLVVKVFFAVRMTEAVSTTKRLVNMRSK
ncbi:unnamed protein product [Acanthoscelides obtectus]|uniref:Uncharacterized protein n=1 Tax=Acanthoscelides obtectus TaxID=200917 RepID=A0A9P0LCJ0_ACAOB|nr:unnamed protein product [Acanthoscelides obtectus]CAK1655289.1 hypothetical protein AOBTE_LOCUS19127 [Acanthoscelides obtectus]